MSAGTQLNTSLFFSGSSKSPRVAEQQSIQDLKCRAVRGLVSMFDAEKGLFCRSIRRTRRGVVREGFSRRYTIMALLGLQAFQKAGVRCPIDVDAAIEGLVRDPAWIGGVGDLGLLAWLIAENSPDRLDNLFQRVDLETCLDRFKDAREARTMELAWFLAGLCHAAMAGPSRRWPLDDLAVEAYHRLEDNRGESGLFGHLAARKSLAGILRGRIASFADQVYTIYALSEFATAFHLEEPLEAASECAAVICRLQGPLGQWWWCYDAPTGRVLCRYPVYSVEQYGLAPLALLALEQASGQQFQESIRRGLQWIYGSNELGEDLRSGSGDLIWRCILPTHRRRKYWDTAVNLLRSSNESVPAGPLEVLHESRPYELGLLLYSFARFASAES